MPPEWFRHVTHISLSTVQQKGFLYAWVRACICVDNVFLYYSDNPFTLFSDSLDLVISCKVRGNWPKNNCWTVLPCFKCWLLNSCNGTRELTLPQFFFFPDDLPSLLNRTLSLVDHRRVYPWTMKDVANIYDYFWPHLCFYLIISVQPPFSIDFIVVYKSCICMIAISCSFSLCLYECHIEVLTVSSQSLTANSLLCPTGSSQIWASSSRKFRMYLANRFHTQSLTMAC